MALMVKNHPANAGDARDVGLIPGLGRSPGGGHGNTLASCAIHGSGVLSSMVVVTTGEHIHMLVNL